jgi:hypothetical protein
MKEKKCEAIRRELDELMLGDECSVNATQHLQECGECREFQQKQTRLREIVGGLGTVEAPPDFDFRLRARLANESNAAGFHLRALQWPFATKGVAVAAMLLLFVGGVFLVRRGTVTSSVAPQSGPEMAVGNEAPASPAPKPDQVKEETPVLRPVVASNDGPRKNRVERLAKPQRSLATVDSAVEPPLVFSDSQRQAAIFPIDASLQSLKVSVDDGHGNARTISVPMISFGSQRALTTGNQFAPKGVW